MCAVCDQELSRRSKNGALRKGRTAAPLKLDIANGGTHHHSAAPVAAAATRSAAAIARRAAARATAWWTARSARHLGFRICVLLTNEIVVGNRLQRELENWFNFFFTFYVFLAASWKFGDWFTTQWAPEDCWRYFSRTLKFKILNIKIKFYFISKMEYKSCTSLFQPVPNKLKNSLYM